MCGLLSVSLKGPRWYGCTGALVLHTIMLGPYASVRAHGTFSLLLLLSMCERLTSFAIEVAVERDWVPQLAGWSPNRWSLGPPSLHSVVLGSLSSLLVSPSHSA